MSVPLKKPAFTPIDIKQVHMNRNREILAKYPQIKELYGPDIRLFPAMVAIGLAQFALAYYASGIESWTYFLFLAWSMGGLLTHWLSLGNHELGHNLAFKKPLHNEILGCFANLPQGIPSFVAFKKYHHYHHYYLNDGKNDPDVPSKFEVEFASTPLKKAIWLLCNPLAYALRPLIMMPKPASAKEILNMIFVLAFDFWLLMLGDVGSKMLAFNLISTLLGMGLHPVSGHFISEHYDLYGDDNGQETYSYYGPLNWVSFNVGYHNEHHDFPRISGFNLPKVTAIAPEYYMNLHPHRSWSKVVCDYILNPEIGPFRRIVRREKPQSQ